MERLPTFIVAIVLTKSFVKRGRQESNLHTQKFRMRSTNLPPQHVPIPLGIS
ncbi:hypothetical protein [Enterococcus songbeiensis]